MRDYEEILCNVKGINVLIFHLGGGYMMRNKKHINLTETQSSSTFIRGQSAGIIEGLIIMKQRFNFIQQTIWK